MNSILPGVSTSTGTDLLPKKTCVITIAAMNNYGFVSALHDSTMKNSPNVDCFVWFMGDLSNPRDEAAKKGFEEIRNDIKKKNKFQLVTIQTM